MEQCHEPKDTDKWGNPGCKCGTKGNVCAQGQQCHLAEEGCRGYALASDDFGDSAVGWNSADSLRALTLLFLKGIVCMSLLWAFLGRKMMSDQLSRSPKSFVQKVFEDENTKFQFAFFTSAFFLWGSGTLSMLGYSSKASNYQTKEQNWNDINGHMITR